MTTEVDCMKPSQGVTVSEPQDSVLLVGMTPKLVRNGPHAFRRKELYSYWVENLDQAYLVSHTTSPRLVVVDGSLLGADPQAQVDALEVRPGGRVVISGHKGLRRSISVDIEIIDCQLPGALLLEELGERLGLAGRQHPRVDYVAPVRGVGPDGDIQGMVENVSVGGAGMLVDGRAREGAELEILFPLPNAKPIQARVRVVRVVAAHTFKSSLLRLGVRFLGLTGAPANALQSFVRVSSPDVHRPVVTPWVPRPLI